MRQFGELIGRLVSGGEVLELIGDVGAGKTTLTKGIGHAAIPTISAPGIARPVRHHDACTHFSILAMLASLAINEHDAKGHHQKDRTREDHPETQRSYQPTARHRAAGEAYDHKVVEQSRLELLTLMRNYEIGRASCRERV